MRLTLLFIVLILYSCKTTRIIEKERMTVDSSSIKERDVLKRVLKEELERFEKEKQQWENTGVVFETESCPDSTKTVTKIVFDNGKLKSIEGNVKALNQSLYETNSELLDAKVTLDSMSIELERKDEQLSKKQEVLIKNTKTTVWPWWMWLLIAVGWVARGLWPVVKRKLFI